MLKYQAKMREMWEPIQWCKETFGRSQYYIGEEGTWDRTLEWIKFKNESDFMLFLMRWNHMIIQHKQIFK